MGDIPERDLPASNWTLYTLTAFAGLVAGLIGTYATVTVSSAARIAALEVSIQRTSVALERIERKLDDLHEPRRKDR